MYGAISHRQRSMRFFLHSIGLYAFGKLYVGSGFTLQIGLCRIVSGDGTADWIDRTFYQEPIHRSWAVFHCSEAHLGQSYPLRCGVVAAQAMHAAALMILLADQPLITTGMINELLFHYQATTDVGLVVLF
ncbi:hypothetical protein ACFVS2_04130 [Brevibacillus sp. NPDC058079]|uniref:hypothetical protein n=1 Tax=Brevibacillus sp. NPDC058079 TaxID=3346330 RepID=UPI0036E3C096